MKEIQRRQEHTKRRRNAFLKEEEEKQSIKTIKEPHTGKNVNWEDKEKTWEATKEHVSTINGMEV